MNALTRIALASAAIFSLVAGAQASQVVRSTVLSKDVNYNLDKPGDKIPVRKELELGPEYRGTFVKRVVAEGTGCGQMILVVNQQPLQGSEMTVCSQFGNFNLASSELNYDLDRDGVRSLQIQLVWGNLNINKVGVVITDQFDPWNLRTQLQMCESEKDAMRQGMDELVRSNASLTDSNRYLNDELSRKRTALSSCEANESELNLENLELRKAFEQLALRCTPGRPPVFPGRPNRPRR
ncbi:MAG: hypothetical protein KDD43_09660 [Bdellovibrionales bacterium]|nr:hypothetical protein [Bdellovibrionales bacterium]